MPEHAEGEESLPTMRVRAVGGAMPDADWRPTADFISQLIAERDRLPPQRERRRVTVETALGAYAAVAASGARPLPPGYRTTRLA